MTVEQMAQEAMKRLMEWINRSAGQHLRAMKKSQSGERVAKP